MSSLTVFDYSNNSVRVIIKNNEPWFVAKDLCGILDIRNVSDALTRLDEDEKRNLDYDEVLGLTDNPDTTRLLKVIH